MKTYSFLLSLFAVVSVGAQDIHWTGLHNAWGGGDHVSFSTMPGGNDYVRLYGVENAPEPQVYHHYYNENVLTGSNTSISMNRTDQTMLSIDLTSATAASGFSFTTSITLSENHSLAGPINVNSGIHGFSNTGDASGITLTQSSVWTVADGAQLSWGLPLTGLSGSEGLTKRGGGTLLLDGVAFSFSGQTHIESGAFGGDASFAGDFHFGANARLLFDPFNVLSVSGSVSFDSFGIDSLGNVDLYSPIGTFRLISGNLNSANIRNVGEENAYDLGDGISAWFSIDNDGLSLVVSAPVSWAHFKVDNSGRVDTGSVLGLINVRNGEWVYSYALKNWVYLPEDLMRLGSGAWGFVFETD